MTSSNVTQAQPQPAIRADQTLADLATTWAGASRVFHRYGFDFCCHGQVTVAEACRKKGVPVEQVLAEIREQTSRSEPGVRWDREPLEVLVEYIETHYHAAHRRELDRLHQMAQRVEHVHGEKPTCPRGLAALLAQVASDLELHMQKEEQILFPLIRDGNGGHARMPILVMEGEHVEHGNRLAQLRTLAHEYEPPPDACGTWRALYLGLAELERDVMAHIHLENHVLFPRALGVG